MVNQDVLRDKLNQVLDDAWGLAEDLGTEQDRQDALGILEPAYERLGRAIELAKSQQFRTDS